MNIYPLWILVWLSTYLSYNVSILYEEINK